MAKIKRTPARVVPNPAESLWSTGSEISKATVGSSTLSLSPTSGTRIGITDLSVVNEAGSASAVYVEAGSVTLWVGKAGAGEQLSESFRTAVRGGKDETVVVRLGSVNSASFVAAMGREEEV